MAKKEKRSLLQFYHEIHQERQVYSPKYRCTILLSEISGDPIFHVSEWNFMHVLNKGSYPDLKFNKLNIVIGTMDEHILFDDHTDRAKRDARFDWVFLLREYLKGKSHGKTNKIIRL